MRPIIRPGRFAVAASAPARRAPLLTAALHQRIAAYSLLLQSPLLSQRRFKSNAPNTRRKPSFTTSPFKSSIIARLQERAAVSHDFEPDVEFQRQSLGLLQSAKSPEELRAAIPLCKVIERATEIHGMATAECVRIYEASGRNEDVVQLALRLLRNDFFLVNSLLLGALQACASLHDTARGFQIFEVALERGLLPNRAVFNSVLTLSAAAGDALSSPRVQNVLHRMEQADVDVNHATIHAWMAAYAKAGHHNRVQELLDALVDFGLTPNDYTYGIIMDTYAEQGDYERTMALLAQLQKDGVALADVHYNVALKACGKASQLSQAFHLYEEMKEKKIAPTNITYITMMHAVFHGELGTINSRKVKLAAGGVGALALASVPLLDLQEHYLTVLFCSSLVGSMGLAVYMNPDGAMRALYPNSDEPHKDTVIEAFFRRLREEDHCGRAMYLWREMLKYNVTPDARVYDMLVRTCVKKRHPELAFEGVFEQQNVALVDAETGQFMLSLATTVALLQSLLAQRRMPMADVVFDAARKYRAFQDHFIETKDLYTYDLRAFSSAQTRSYAVRRILAQLHAEAKLFAGAPPRVELLTFHGYDLLDQIDMDDPQIRALFAMEEMTREMTRARDGPTAHQQFFRLSIPRERFAAFLAAPLAATSQQRL